MWIYRANTAKNHNNISHVTMDVTYMLWDNAQPGTSLNILLMNQRIIPYKNATKNPNPTKYMYDNGAGPPTPFMMDSNG